MVTKVMDPTPHVQQTTQVKEIMAVLVVVMVEEAVVVPVVLEVMLLVLRVVPVEMDLRTCMHMVQLIQ